MIEGGRLGVKFCREGKTEYSYVTIAACANRTPAVLGASFLKPLLSGARASDGLTGHFALPDQGARTRQGFRHAESCSTGRAGVGLSLLTDLYTQSDGVFLQVADSLEQIGQRCEMAKGLVQHVDAEISFQCFGDAPNRHYPVELAHDHAQIVESPTDEQVGNVGPPYPIVLLPPTGHPSDSDRASTPMRVG